MYGGPSSWTGGCSCKELAAASGQHGTLPEHQQQGRPGPSAVPASPREQTSHVPARPPPWLQYQRAQGHGVLPAPHSQASGLCASSRGTASHTLSLSHLTGPQVPKNVLSTVLRGFSREWQFTRHKLLFMFLLYTKRGFGNNRGLRRGCPTPAPGWRATEGPCEGTCVVVTDSGDTGQGPQVNCRAHDRCAPEGTVLSPTNSSSVWQVFVQEAPADLTLREDPSCTVCKPYPHTTFGRDATTL